MVHHCSSEARTSVFPKWAQTLFHSLFGLKGCAIVPSGEMWPLLAVHGRTHSLRRHHRGDDLRGRAGWLGLQTLPDQLCKLRRARSGAVPVLRGHPRVRPTHCHVRLWTLRPLQHCFLQELNPTLNVFISSFINSGVDEMVGLESPRRWDERSSRFHLRLAQGHRRHGESLLTSYDWREKFSLLILNSTWGQRGYIRYT